MNKPPKALLAAIDQMEQLPGIAGVFSEVRLQIFHREAIINRHKKLPVWYKPTGSFCVKWPHLPEAIPLPHKKNLCGHPPP